MNVVGILQTDLNEFQILFERGDQQQQGNQQQGKQQNNSGSCQQQDQGNPLSFLGFGGNDSGSDGNSASTKNGGNQQLQEMTVRIKGIPEGQKATFLQMYQIIQDAKCEKELEEKLTIVSRGGDNQENGNNNGIGFVSGGDKQKSNSTDMGALQ